MSKRQIDPAELSARITHARRFWVWPTLIVMGGVTLYGNVSAAHSVGGVVMHVVPPLAYLVLVHILMFGMLEGGWAMAVYVMLVCLAGVAGFLSFATLKGSAVKWGAEPGQAWLFPVLVDMTVVAMTLTLFGSMERIASLSVAPTFVENEPNKGGRPKEFGSRRNRAELSEAREQVRVESEIGSTAGLVQDSNPFEQFEMPDSNIPDHTELSGLIVREFGSQPELWPASSSMVERFGKSKSSVSDARKRARTILELTSDTPQFGGGGTTAETPAPGV